jgi:uncharacterized protein YbaA (DUF1428 family)
MPYVDGFVIPVPTKNLAAYRKMSKLGGKVWKEYGALEYRECLADDMATMSKVTFPGMVKAKKGETVIFSWIVYKSKADRNRINKKVMADKRITSWDPKSMPFDWKRMAYGGFKTIVDM